MKSPKTFIISKSYFRFVYFPVWQLYKGKKPVFNRTSTEDGSNPVTAETSVKLLFNVSRYQ